MYIIIPMRALVTGAAGFIGSNLVDKLIKNNIEVIAVDNLSVGLKQNINPKAIFHQVDFRDYDKLVHLTKGVEIFYHIGAVLPIIRPPFENTVEHEEINVIGTIQAVKSAAKNNVKKFVYASTCAVYGNTKNFPITEKNEINLITRPYSIQKFAGEQIAILLGKRYEMPVTSLRYFATYGPRGFYPNKPNNSYSPVIGIFLNQKLNQLPLTVTGDGLQKRDFVYVDDVARITMEVGLKNKGEFDFFNLCSSDSISIIELAKKISNDIKFIDKTVGEVDHVVADNSKLYDVFGLKPKFDLDTGIEAYKNYLLQD